MLAGKDLYRNRSILRPSPILSPELHMFSPVVHKAVWQVYLCASDQGGV